MNKAKNQNCIALKFFDFNYSPHVLTEQLKLVPTKIALKGEVRKMKLLWKSNMWNYEERSVTNEFIGNQVEEFVLRILLPISQDIKKVLDDCNGELSIAQYYYDGCNPGYHFSKKILAIINETGLEIDIDTYCLESTKK